MRISRTLIALAALLLVTACGSSADLLAPEARSADSATTGERGGIGMIGSGNSAETDPPATTTTTEERGGIGMIGSGN